MFDHEVDSISLAYQFKSVQISETETKYFFADTTTNTFSLFNMDFTPFLLNISVPEPFDLTGNVFQALYITRGLFDCDTSNIEYMYTSLSNNNKPFKIMRTDGTILFELDSANSPYCLGNCLGLSDAIRPIVNTSSGAKLFLQRYVLGYQQILIYSLCGLLPNDIFENIINGNDYVSVFPNPNSGIARFSINLPDNINEYKLVITTGNGKVIKCENLSRSINNLTLNIENYASGTYYYYLSSKDKNIQSGKLILTK